MNKCHLHLAAVALITALANGPAHAQTCAPGPRCQAASDKAQAYMSSAQARLKGPFIAAGAAAANYCVMMVVAEVNRLCGVELQSSGANQCAALAFSQAEEFKRNAAQSKAASEAMSAVSSSAWQGGCGW